MQRELVSGPLVPQEVRDFIGAQLNAVLGSSPRADVTDDARLIASELATNAIRAGSTSVGLLLELHHAAVRIEVRDDAPGTPVMRSPHPEASTGRGLLIVDTLATEWGAVPHDGGKVVWATLAVPASLTRELTCQRRLGA